MLIENIIWDLSKLWRLEETYEQLRVRYGLPQQTVVSTADPEECKEILLDKYRWPVLSFTVSPEVIVSMEFSLTESFSLTELCDDLQIHPLDIESIYVKWMNAYIKLKDGRRIEHDLSGDIGNEPDYKWPIHCHVYDADGNLLAEKQNPTTLPLAWAKPSPEESAETPSPSPSNSKGDSRATYRTS